VSADIPQDCPIEEQLAFCEHNLIRIAARRKMVDANGTRNAHVRYTLNQHLADLIPRSIAKSYFNFYVTVKRPIERAGKFARLKRRRSYWVQAYHRSRKIWIQVYYKTQNKLTQAYRKSRKKWGQVYYKTRNKLTRAYGKSRAVRQSNWRTAPLAVWHIPIPAGIIQMSNIAFEFQGAFLRFRYMLDKRNYQQKVSMARMLLAAILAIRLPATKYAYRIGYWPHLNACGDFTLMSREDWFKLRGYAEFELFSMHLDSVLCMTAWWGGMRQHFLAYPMRLYHIEHESGFTPEKWSTTVENLLARGIPLLSFDELRSIDAGIRLTRGFKMFNDDDWGLVAQALPETIIDPLPSVDA
jgi:hypothetical protein